MKGEDGKTTEAEQQREFEAGGQHDYDNFQAKTPWQRLAIVVAGPIANFILAFVILLISAVFFGVADLKTSQPIVGPLTSGFPAEKAGLQAGDLITAINGNPVSGAQLLLTSGSLGHDLAITFVRTGVTKTIHITPVACPKGSSTAGRGCIGFSPIPQFRRVGIGEAVSNATFGMRALWDQSVGGLVLLVSHPRQYAAQLFWKSWINLKKKGLIGEEIRVRRYDYLMNSVSKVR